MEGGGEICRLPEGCISHILSLTSPRDSCRSSLVSPTFRSAADSDALWERFLPSDYEEILSRAVDPVRFSSRKQLYFRLCDSILIDGGRKSFGMEKGSGGICYMVCARDLLIALGNDQRHWSWISHPESRFTVVAALRVAHFFDVSGKMNCKVLSPNTTYRAYFIFKLSCHSSGFHFYPQRASVRVGAHLSKRHVRLEPNKDHTLRPPGEGVPQPRGDGWMEIELGEFFSGQGDDGEVLMSLTQVEIVGRKLGLIIEGFQVRPKYKHSREAFK